MGELSMRAIVVEGGRGGPEALVLREIARPEPKPGEVLIRVAAAGVNRPDVLQRLGHYPPPPGAPDTLGLEVAGEVVGVGADAALWKVGDKVTALLGGGGYAEFAVVDARHALPVPKGLSLIEAAGLPETVFTVFTNVFERGRLKSGETLLVHGATSGIGVSAIKMAKAAGARVITTSRGATKAEAAKALGADLAIDSTAGDWVETVNAAGGADVILDIVGGSFTARNLACLKLEGRLVQVSFQAGSVVELDLRRLMTMRLTITGSTLRPRPADEKARLAAAVEQTVWPWIEAGHVRIPIDSTFPLERAGDAHRRLEGGEHLGKIVLTA
jgi:putative PIG3 family NAD(P)H quinone oxidoreductase